MKKSTVLLMALMLGVLLMGGCTSKDNDDAKSKENPFEDYESEATVEGTSQEKIAVSCNVAEAPENMTFEYNGKPIEFDYVFESDGNCEMGLAIFINGYIQQFTVDSKKTQLHKEKLKDNQTSQFSIKLSPNTGKKGENMQLIFANIFNPKIIHLSGGINTFGNNHNVFQPMPWTIKMNADAKETDKKVKNNYKEIPLTKEELDGFITVDKDGNRRNKLDQGMEFVMNYGKEQRPVVSIKKDKSIKYTLLGNFPGKYRVSFFGDFKHIKINGGYYTDIDVKNDNKYEIDIPLKENNLDKYDNFYGIAVPINNNNGLIKSHSIYMGD
ncbi:MAG: hypothetical protein RR313_07195 [Anaerovoracaceae bacterium]